MAESSSISKGVFLFKNGFKKNNRNKKKSTFRTRTNNLFLNHLWYQTFKKQWELIKDEMQEFNNNMFDTVLNNLMIFLKNCYQQEVSEIPTACLLTGINMPDHQVQFDTLIMQIRKDITPHVILLNADSCLTLKYAIEYLINQLLYNDDDLKIKEEQNCNKIFQKSQCSFSLVQEWYENLYKDIIMQSPKKLKTHPKRKSIIIVIPDIEIFNNQVLQNLINIAFSYLNVLPLIFVFGVATSFSTLHRTLSYNVLSKIYTQIFQKPPATVYLNNLLENVLFRPKCLFHLGGKVLQLFTDIFLFYDLSVIGFMKNIKFAMCEHYSFGNAMTLSGCTNEKELDLILNQFSHDDFENCRRILSFRILVEKETPKNQIKLLTDDNYFRNVLKIEILILQNYLKAFYLFIKCLHIMVHDLPEFPLGKQVREIYVKSTSQNITETEEYKRCFQLLYHQSQHELCQKLEQIIVFLDNYRKQFSEPEIFKCFLNDLNSFLILLKSISLTNKKVEENFQMPTQIDRKQLKEKLIERSRSSKQTNEYEQVRMKILEYFDKKFQFYLSNPSKLNFHEIFFFNDLFVQNHLIGSQRAAIHTALNNPCFYLKCNCCRIQDVSLIVKTMPDICITYKLHLEYGKMINLFDWLQAFISIVEDQRNDNDENPTQQLDPLLQARFTQAISELEFLGFIKSSKTKLDHVTRLTWGG